MTITLTVGGAASVADGVLSGATSTASGVYTIVGTPGAVTTALQALIFTPTSHQVTPGSTVTTGITLVASQVAGGSTTSATNSTGMVVATAVNDAPTIAGASTGQTTDESTTFTPLSATTVADVDTGTTEIVTITLTVGGAASVADGVLSGATSTATGVYTIVGAPGAVTTALQALIFTPTSHQVTPGSTVTTGITLVASQVAGGSTTSATNSAGTVVATAVNDAPTITVYASQTNDESTIFQPLSAATIGDVDLSTTETVTITLTVGGAASVADGVLSGATSTGTGVYTIVGAPGAVTTALQALIFTPTSHQVTPGSTVTTGITLVASQVAGGSTTSATNSTGMVVATAVNDAPTIAGATTGQTTDESTTFTPLSATTVADVDLSTTETVTITLTVGGAASVADGVLSGATSTSSGVYTIVGTPGAVTTALQALIFTPTSHQVTPGSTVTTGITLVASQVAGGSTTSATNSTATVVATAVNDAPTITVYSSQANDGSTIFQPLSAATIGDVDLSTTETVTITLTVGGAASVADGSLSGATSTGTGVYTIVGAPGAVTTALQALIFTPTSHQVTPGSTVTTGITLVASQVAGGSTTSATNSTGTIVATAVNDAPTIAGATTGQTTDESTTFTPLSATTVADVDLSTTEIVTITLTVGGAASVADGVLSGATSTGTGVYTIVGARGAVTTALQALIFTPTSHQVTPGSTVTTGITLVASQVAGGSTTSATNSTGMVVATAVNDAPTIAGATTGQTTDESTTFTPLSATTVADVDLSTTEIVTITLTVGGTASVADGVLSGAISTASGVYTIVGTPGAVTTALQALIFTPTSHQVTPGSTVTTGITLVASQVAGGSTTSSSTSIAVVATAVNDAPTITVYSSQTTDDSTSFQPLSAATIGDVDLSTTETVTITLTVGGTASVADGSLSGASSTGMGVYTITGTPDAVTTALAALIFTPTSHQVSPGSTVTTGITLVASQVAGGSTTSATNSTATVVATAVNDAPTIAGTSTGQTTDESTTFTPLSATTVADVDLSTTETVTITLTVGGAASVADGVLSGAASTGTGVYTIVGAPGAVTTALAALIFTPTSHQVAPGSTVTTGITLVASQVAGGSTTSVTNTAGTVVATAVNDAPTIAGTTAGETTDESTTFAPLSAATVGDVDTGTTEIVTITLTVGGAASVADGVLSGATSTSTGVYTIVGAPGAVTTALQSLIFTPTSHQVAPGSTVTTGITLVASQVAGGSTTSATNSTGMVVATAVNDAPTIAGATTGQTTDESTTFTPLSATTVADVDLSTTETVTITLTVGGTASVADGVLSGATSTGTGVYTIVGSPGAVTTALQALIFTPTSHQVTPGSTVTTGITLVASQVAGGSTTSATNSTGTIVATAVNDAPTIAGATTGQTTDESTTFTPLSAATIADVDTGTTEILTITMTVGGAASVADGVLDGATSTGTGVYTIVGTPGAVTTALQSLIFTPTSHQVAPGSTVTTGITLVASQVAGGSTTSATNTSATVVATAVNDAPTIAVYASQTDDESTSFTPLSAATVADVDTGTTEIVTITLTVGGSASVANGVLSGATSTGTGVYTIVGSPGAVTTALAALVFTPTSHQVSPGSTVTTGITLVATQIAGGSTTSATNSTGTVVATAVNDAPTIAGTTAGETTDESTTFAPLSAATVGDVDTGTTEIVTITLTVGGAASVADGVLSGATSTSSGVYTIVGTPGAVTTALQALIFTPTSHQVTPGSTVTTGITLVASQVAGGSTTSATNSTGMVVATAVNDAPTIAGTATGQTTDESTTFTPLSPATVADVDTGTTEIVTITLTVGGAASVADGVLSGATSTGIGVYTIVGAPGAVTTALAALVFTPTSHQVAPGSTVTTGITLVASQVAGGSTMSASDSTTLVVATAVNDAPTLAGASAGQAITDDTTATPLSGVTIADVDLSTSEIVTITLSGGDANATLTGATWIAAGTYTIVGTPGAATTALEALVFHPTAHQVSPGSTVTTGITLIAAQVAGGSTALATNATTTVIATAANDAPTIAGASAGQATIDNTTGTPFSGVTIADVDLSSTETITITLSGGDANATLIGATRTAAGIYTIVGAPGAVTAALETLVFKPTAHQVTPGSSVTTGITILATQIAGSSTTSATDSTTTVIATAANDAPTVSGATAGQVSTDDATTTPLSGVTVADVDLSTTETVTVILSTGTLSGGDANATLSGATRIAAGTYTIVGTPGAATTALEALVFHPTAHQVTPGSTVTTGITLVASQVAGGSTTSVTNSTTTVVTIAANDAPTITGAAAGQVTTDDTTIDPTSGVTVADVDLSTIETVTITLSGGDANATLSGATRTGAGTYTISGTAGAVTTALDALMFTPGGHQVSPGSTVTTSLTLVAMQVAGGSTRSATDATTTIIATAANDAPTIVGAAAGQASTDDTAVTPLSTVTIADADLSTTETLTIELTAGGSASDADGTLAGAARTASGTYTIIGTPGAVTTALASVVFTPTAHQVSPGNTVTTSILLFATQTAGGSTTSATDTTTTLIATAVNDAPTITGVSAVQTISDTSTLMPLASARVADPDIGTSEIVTITLGAGDSNGSLSGAARIGVGLYTLAGVAGAVTTALAALIFTPTAYQVAPGSMVTTSLAIVAEQLAGGRLSAASSASSEIITTASNPAPVIIAPGSAAAATTVANDGSVMPFAGFSIVDPSFGAIETLTIAITQVASPTGTDLSQPNDAYATLTGATEISDGVYTLIGVPDVVTTGLEGVVFTSDLPADSAVDSVMTLTVTDNHATSAATRLTIFGTVAEAALTIGGIRTSHTISNSTTIAPFVDATVSDPNGFAPIDTLIVSSSNTLAGVLSDAAGGEIGADGWFRVTGRPAAVQAAWRGLVFTPTAGEADTGTGLDISLRDNAGQTANSSTVALQIVAATSAAGVTALNEAHSTDYTAIQVFSATNVSTNTGATETAIISISAANGTLFDPYGTLSGDGLTLTVTGDAAEVAAALAALQFIPDQGQSEPGTTITTGVTFTLDDGSAITTQVATVSVVASFTPFSDLSITTDAADIVETMAVAITASPAGSFSNLGIGRLTSDGAGNQFYTLTGTAAEINAALAGVVFTPADLTSDRKPEITVSITGVAVSTTAPKANFTTGATATTIVGGAGQVTISGGSGGGLFEGGTAGGNLLTAGGASTTLVGGGSGDLLVASATGGDVLLAGSGAETLDGTAANASAPAANVLVAGTAGGTNILYGGGSDTVVVTSGRNTVGGAAAGHPLIYLGNGQNLVQGDGAETVVSGGSTTVYAGAGSVLDWVGGSATWFVGDNSASTVVGSAGSVTVFGGAGGGVFFAGAGGGNVLIAGTGAATMVGGGQGDMLQIANSDGNLLVAGAGAETLDGSAATGANLFFSSPTTASMIETGAGADTVVLTGGAATVGGSSAGSALIFLDAGLSLVQAEGATTLVGGTGNATIEAAGAAVVDWAGGGTTQFIGGSASSTVFGGIGSVTVQGGSGGGVFRGGAEGANSLISGAGAVTLFGGGGGDLLTLSNGLADLVVAASGNETLNAAGAGSGTTLVGGAGADWVTLGSGAESFVAGSGQATVIAGSGADQFVIFEGSACSLTIDGFSAGVDTISLRGYASAEAAAAVSGQVVRGGNTILSLGDGTSITLIGVRGVTAGAFSS